MTGLKLNLSSKKIEVVTNYELLNFVIDTSKMNHIKNIDISYLTQNNRTKISNLLTFMEKDIFNKVANLHNLDLYFFNMEVICIKIYLLNIQK